jgi:Tfp pilus assembly protein PilX
MRKYQFTTPSSQDGYLVLLLAIMIVIVGFVGAVVTNMFFSSTFSTTSHYNADRALYLAEAGLEHATHKLLEPTVTNRSACAGLSISNVSLGPGNYTVTSTGPTFISAPTILNGNLTAATRTITVNSTTGYSSSGRIMIDLELMNYSSITATTFANVTRGVDNTIATTHVTGTPVGQYQCNLTSKGGVPNLVSPAGKRTVAGNTQLQEAWAAGDTAASGNFTVGQWNVPAEDAWTNPAIAGGFNINSVFLLSYVDGWFVGAAGNAVKWSGDINTSTAVALPQGVDYFDVYCTATNNCHAVGARSGARQTISDWNGATWTRTIAVGNTRATNLKSVHCDSSTDCWAVGDNNGASDFYQWTGAAPWTGYLNTLTGYPFHGVFCNAANDCWAVGSTAVFGRLTAGTSWVNFATGLPVNTYNGIFCNATDDCWVVGNVNGGKDMFAHWNGTAWSRDASNPTPIANLNAVKCANTQDCWAVGASTAGNNPVFVHWDGTAWTQFAAAGFPAATLRGLSIISPTATPMTNWQENFP